MKLEEDFNKHGSFSGEMTSINLWDRALTDAEISKLAQSCSAGKGNLVSMADTNIIGVVQQITLTCNP